ncbi:MAG: YdeI/OmpD-associated family protein [Bacteroidota bacterium]
MKSFSAVIYKIGINPYVIPPASTLKYLFTEAGKEKGPIPIRIQINGQSFIQHLVKYSGKWRLYLNGPMRKAADADVGDKISITLEYDSAERTVPVPEALINALKKNKKAKVIFDSLIPSRKKEISRYIASLKTEESIGRNVEKAIQFLLGKQRFIGRDKP